MPQRLNLFPSRLRFSDQEDLMRDKISIDSVESLDIVSQDLLSASQSSLLGQASGR